VTGGKIDRIELYHVEIPLPTPLFPVWIPGYPQYRLCSTLLAVTTKDGLTGYATAPAFERERESLGDFIGQFLLGLDAYDLDAVRERLRQASFLGWRNHWMDVAFWDLAAKAQGVPLHQLLFQQLGGQSDAPSPAAVPVYASFLELRPPRVRAEAIERAQRLGFRGVKIPVHSIKEQDDLDQLILARQVAGPNFDLFVHAHQAWSVSLVEEVPHWTLDRARRFVDKAAELGYHWVQEPLHDEAWADLAALNQDARIDIAGGDLTFTFVPLKALIQERSYELLTPDTSFAGLSIVRQTLAACLKSQLGFSPSSKGDGLGLLANLHALVAWARLSGQADVRLEFPWEPPAVIPEHRDILLKTPLSVPNDGLLPVPTGPGLGAELDPRTLKRHAHRFYSLTPVKFVVNSARRSGLKQTAELARGEKRRTKAITSTD